MAKKEKLRYSDVVRLVQFASWAGQDPDEHLSKADAEELVDDFLEEHGASSEATTEVDDFSDLGLDL